jgi:hypothetical protein
VDLEIFQPGLPGVRYIKLQEDEMVALIRAGHYVEFAFGAGGCAVKWDPSTPLTPVLRALVVLRSQNTGGAGI